MAISSDEKYSTRSRTIFWKVDIYFNGPSGEPLSVTRDNYLINCDLLEEATSGDTLFDSPSANEITVSLHSPHGIFNPNNVSSPYHGKIRRGIKLVPYIKAAEEDDWSQLGEFFVTKWNAGTTAQTATVVADDVLYGVFGNEDYDFRPQISCSVANFWNTICTHFGLSAVIDNSITEVLPIAYITTNNKKLFEHLAIAFLSICNVNHQGKVAIRNARIAQALRATLTDADQIISIKTDLSIDTLYDSAKLVYRIPQVGSVKQVYKNSKAILVPGVNVLNFEWDTIPLYRFVSCSAHNGSQRLLISNLACSSRRGSISLRNPSPDTELQASISFQGTCIETYSIQLGEDSDNILSLDNEYVQGTEQAEQLYEIMQRYTGSILPIIEVDTRGNPNLNIGDKVRVVHDHNGVDFTGIIIRQHFHYDGGLSCQLTILNADLVEVTS